MSQKEDLSNYYRSHGVSVVQRPEPLNPDILMTSEVISPGHELPPEIEIIPVSVAVVLFRENQKYYCILNQDDKGGTFNLVGGTIEKGETREQGVIRETSEETGYLIEQEQLIELGALIFDTFACPLYLIDVTSQMPGRQIDKLDSVSIAIFPLGELLSSIPMLVKPLIEKSIYIDNNMWEKLAK